MYAEANMGHPSREHGFVLCSNHSPADEFYLGGNPNLVSVGVPLFYEPQKSLTV